jgi:hypothetical protein
MNLLKLQHTEMKHNITRVSESIEIRATKQAGVGATL